MSELCSIIVPCYNEESKISETIRDIRKVLPDADLYSIYVVNDGSKDGTADELIKIEKEVPGVHVIHHQQNFGYGAALKAGIRASDSELIAITDADGTYPISDLPNLISTCSNYDMVVGARTGENVTYSKLRAIPKFFFKRWVNWITKRDVPDINSGMRVFRRHVAMKFFNIYPNGFSFTITITIAMLTNYHRVLFVPIGYNKRIGDSKIQPIRDTLRFSQIILRTGNYFAPARIYLPFACVLAVFGTISLAYDLFIIQNLTDKTILIFLFMFNVGLFALLADMVDKRSR